MFNMNYIVNSYIKIAINNLKKSDKVEMLKNPQD